MHWYQIGRQSSNIGIGKEKKNVIGTSLLLTTCLQSVFLLELHQFDERVMHHDELTPALQDDVILLKHDHKFIELLPRPGQITSAWTANCCTDRTCGCFDNQMVSPTANLPSLSGFKH